MTLLDFEVIVLTPEIIEAGMELAILHSFSSWDAWIVAAAIDARCGRILTENMRVGSIVSGVRIESPFG